MVQEMLFQNIPKTYKEKNNLLIYPSIPRINSLNSFKTDLEILKRKYGKEFIENEIELVIEEKFNGINIGIFYNNNTIKIMTKGYIYNSDSFSNHKKVKVPEELIKFVNLEKDNSYIIFGELLDFVYGNKFMKQYKSSKYNNKLKRIFVIFDIYSIKQNRFLDKEELLKFYEYYEKVTKQHYLINKEEKVLISPILEKIKGFNNLLNNSKLFKENMEKKSLSILNPDVLKEGIIIKPLYETYYNDILNRIIYKVKQYGVWLVI